MINNNIKNIFDFVYKEKSQEQIEEFLNNSALLLINACSSDKIDLTKEEEDKKEDLLKFLSRLYDNEITWAHSPNYLITRSLLFLRYKNIRLNKPSFDLGCGDARTTFLAYPEHKFNLGIDILPEDIKTAKSFDKHAKLFVSDARHIDNPNNSFNTIVSNHTIYHIPDKIKVFKEVNRLLKPGGYFYFDDITKRMYDDEDRVFIKLMELLGHDNLVKKYKQNLHSLYKDNRWDLANTPENMAEILKSCGLELVKHQYFMASRTAKIGWFLYDLVNTLGREFHFYFSKESGKVYRKYVKDHLIPLILSDSRVATSYNNSNYVFYSVRKR